MLPATSSAMPTSSQAVKPASRSHRGAAKTPDRPEVSISTNSALAAGLRVGRIAVTA